MKKVCVILLSFLMIIVCFSVNAEAEQVDDFDSIDRASEVQLTVGLSEYTEHNAYESAITLYGYMNYRILVSGYITINRDGTVAKRYDNTRLVKVDWEAPFEPIFNKTYSNIYYQNGIYYLKVSIQCNLHSPTGATLTTHTYVYELSTSVR